MIRLFTDGACKSNGKREARGSYAYYFPEHPDWSGASLIPDTDSQTNNRGELLGIYHGVQKAFESCDPSNNELVIYSDSTYSINCLTKWLPGWLRNHWKTAEGKDVLHKDLIEKITILLSKFSKFKILYVKAHSTSQDELSINNNIVDKMATQILYPQQKQEINTTENIFPNLDLRLMGPAINQDLIIEWCLKNLDKLDKGHLNTALLMAFQKTLNDKGYKIESQKINKQKVIKLISKTNIVDTNIII
jgi:ribonuclease HI